MIGRIPSIYITKGIKASYLAYEAESVYGIRTRYNESCVRIDSREVIRQLKLAGWYEVNHVGSHRQFKHPTQKGRVTVPHPKRDLAIGTLKSIEKQAQNKFSPRV